MSKEMYISSSPHETKVAVLEDDQLVEVYFERDTDVGLVGGIYKGRVSRVLPGMQSAFVDIGLERDAFLYVSDFLRGPGRIRQGLRGSGSACYQVHCAAGRNSAAAPLAAPAVTEPPPPVVAEVAPPPVATAGSASPSGAACRDGCAADAGRRAPAPRESHDRRPFDPRRGRRRRHRGRPDFGEGRHGDRRFPPPHRPEEPPTESHTFEILPGESLAKYSHAASAPTEEAEAGMPEDTLPEVGQGSPILASEGTPQDNTSRRGRRLRRGQQVPSFKLMKCRKRPQSVPRSRCRGHCGGRRNRTRSCCRGYRPSRWPEYTVSATDATVTFAPGAIQCHHCFSRCGKRPRRRLPERPFPRASRRSKLHRRSLRRSSPTASAPASPAAEPEPVAEIPASSFAPAEVAAYLFGGGNCRAFFWGSRAEGSR